MLGLAGQFPPESALQAAKRGGYEFRMWTPQAHLLAAAVNLLNAANRQRAGKRTTGPLVAPPKKKAVRRITVAEIAKRQRERAQSN